MDIIIRVPFSWSWCSFKREPWRVEEFFEGLLALRREEGTLNPRQGEKGLRFRV